MKIISKTKREKPMFKAKDVMKTDIVTVGRQTPVYEAIRTLVENNITGLPVVNDDGSIAGIVTEKDVLSLLYNIEDGESKVEDFMTKGVVSFNQEDSLIDITECLIENHFRRVTVTSNGKLVGIISRKDIIAYILKLRRKDKTAV